MTDFVQFLIHRLREAAGFAALVGVVFASVSFGLFILQRKKAAEPVSWKRVAAAVLFSMYLAALVSVTLMRGERGAGEINLHFFRAWREAWNSFSARNWLNVLLNVALFVPLGIGLPVLFPWFRRWDRVLAAGLAVSLLIETVQYLLGLGLADVDDLAANSLGTLLGGSIFLTRKRRIWIALPAAFLLALGAVFGYYAVKPYGNLMLAASYRVNTDGYVWNLEWEPDDRKPELPVYRATGFDQAASDAFARDFFARLDVELHDSSRYGDSTFYANRNPGHFLFVNHADRNFTYSVPSNGQQKEWGTVPEDQIRLHLASYGVTAPDTAVFEAEGDGWYRFSLIRSPVENGILDGTLRCRIAADGTVSEIEQFLQHYVYRAAEPGISEREALERLQRGWFPEPYKLRNETSPAVTVHGVELEYRIDTKGFYVPVYVFSVSVNGESLSGGLLIPAI